MSATEVMKRVTRNPETLANTLPSSKEMKRYDWCHGIHGAARWRRGFKRGTSAARRRAGKRVILQSVQEAWG